MKNKYNLNDTVEVNEGIHTEDFDINISGYVGTITDIIDDGDILYQIDWDATTLNKIELTSLQYLEEQMYDWEFTLLHESEIQKSNARCSPEETQQALNTIKEKMKSNS